MAPSQRRLRGWLYQAAVVLLLGFVAVVAARNLSDNLATRGLLLGFDFLWHQAGFGIGFSIIPFTETDTYWRVFIVRFTNTPVAAGLVIFISTILRS